MAGNLVPLVMIPRFSSYAGATSFRTIAMDVTAYQNAILNVWRGPLCGTATPTFAVTFEESTDQVDWTACTTTPDPTNPANQPAANSEVQFNSTLKKRWFRAIVTLTGTDVVVSCWAVGFLEERQN